MGDKTINILIVGNPDAKISEIIPYFEKLGNKGENSYIKIFDYQIKFEPFNISKKGDVEIIPNIKDYNIIFLCFDYREDDSFENIDNFYKKNKHKDLFYGIIGFSFEVINKKVSQELIENFAKENYMKLYNVVIHSTFQRVFQNILEDYFSKKNIKKPTGTSKQKLQPNKEDESDIYICKIGLIGSKAGKTTLSNTYKTGKFNPNTSESTLINNVTKIITYTPDNKKKLKIPNETNNIKVKIELWDTPHVGRNWENMNFVMMVAKSVDVIIYLYDNNNKDTFYDIKQWDNKIHDNIVKNAIFCVVENQTDKKGNDDFSIERSNLASDIGAEKHFCIDASNKDSVNQMIMDIVSFYLIKVDLVVEKSDKEMKIENKENIEKVEEEKKEDNLNKNVQNNKIQKDIPNKIETQKKKNNNNNGTSCCLF